MSAIKTVQQTITPEQAGKWLGRHYERIQSGKFVQRPVVQSTVNRYASDMGNGSWLLSPQPIAFDEEENLIDGQHRLEGIRKSKKSIEMLVSTGWPVDKQKNNLYTIDIIDRGRNRTTGNQLHLHGWSHANNYASCITSIARLCNHGSCSVSYPGVLFALDALDFKTHIDKIMLQTSSHRDFLGRTVGPLAYYHTVSPRKAEDFAEAYFNGTAPKGSGVSALARYAKNCAGNIHTDMWLKAICSAIRTWDENEEVQFIKPHLEAMKWLVNSNLPLKDKVLKISSSTRRVG